MPLRASSCATVLAVVLLGCSSGGGSGDTYDVTVDENPLRPELTDDAAPPVTPFDGALSYTGRHGVENHSADRFRFDVAPFRDDAERAAAERLFPSHADYLAAHPGALPSVQTIGTYEKQLDDQIYAGVEHAVQQGLEPTVQPKRSILGESLQYLAAHRSAGADEAIAVIAAALEVGGAKADVPPDLAGAVAAEKAKFAANGELSKPIGFYTWSAELEAGDDPDRRARRDPLALLGRPRRAHDARRVLVHSGKRREPAAAGRANARRLADRAVSRGHLERDPAHAGRVPEALR